MLRYTEEEVKAILGDLIEGPVKIRPIGNHHLNRHLVYHVTNDHELSVVFKLFYKRNRWTGEVATFKILKDSSVKAPPLLQADILADGTEYILVEYVPGKTFEQVREQVPKEGQRRIFLQMGEELGKVHAIREFDFFGPWDEDCNPIRPWGDFKSRFIWNAEIRMEQIYEQNLKEEPLMREAYEEIKKCYDLLDGVTHSRLCCSDYGPRNVIVDQVNGQWQLTGLIDFEHSAPWDPDRDLADIFTHLFFDDQEMEPSFLEGYQKYHFLGDNFYSKRRMYILNTGLGICSWAKKEAPEFYQKGIKILKRYV